MEDVLIRAAKMCAILAGVGVLWLFTVLPERKVKRLLKSRPAMDFEEWYARYYADSELEKDTVRQFYEFVAKQVFPVHPTRLLPTDRFDVELACPMLKGWPGGDYYDAFCDAAVEFVQEYGASPEQLWTERIATIGEGAEHVCGRVAGRQRRTEKQPLWGKLLAYTILAAMAAAAIYVVWGLVKWVTG